MKRSRRRTLLLLVSTTLCAPAISHAVRIADDGMGQALVYPYYTVQKANGDGYDTYVSIVNHTSDAKALRLRFREGRASRETLSLNLYLAPNDVWTGAVIPDYPGPISVQPSPPTPDLTTLVTADISCTSPPIPARGMPFQNTAYSGANDDGNGAGLDRSREGFVEVIEMGTLTGAAAAAVTHNSAGIPPNCAAVQGNAALSIAAPSGGLSGTMSLINVQNGINFDLNAVALADVSTKSFYRPASDPYPDFNAAEIDPVSLVVANGAAYRATWSRPVDAVSAVLMSTAFLGEYVLDDETASNTDFVATFPTRQFYVTATSIRFPFTPPVVGAPPHWAPHCGDGGIEVVSTLFLNRDERASVIATDCGFPECPPGPPAPTLCAATAVIDTSNGNPHTAITTQSRVLGSLVRGYSRDGFVFPSSFTHGWLRTAFVAFGASQIGVTSLPDSTRMDLATGAITTGPQTYYGLPVVGFTARTFVNGTLTCSAGACQGNYGGAFPFQYIRRISP